MPAGTVAIDKYTVSVASNGYSFPAGVFLYRADNTLCGFLRFYGPETTPPSNNAPSSFPSSGYIQLYYPISSFPSVMDILRNEKPLNLIWLATPPAGVITTGTEPVGEEESS
jgi:hypothetical protein